MFIRIINGLEEAMISILLATMTLLVFLEVVLRFGFSTGFMWAQELTLHLSFWMVMLGVSYGVKVGSHIGVDVLVKIMPDKARRVVSSFAVIACLTYCGLFSYGVWGYLAKMYKYGIELEDMPIPKWVAHSMLLIGMIMIAIRLLQLLWAIATGKTDSFNLVDEAKESMHLAEETQSAATAQRGDSA